MLAQREVVLFHVVCFVDVVWNNGAAQLGESLIARVRVLTDTSFWLTMPKTAADKAEEGGECDTRVAVRFES